jgi:hypothetical protein
MSRHDVANLVIRTFALWLGVVGVTALVTMPWLTRVPDQPAPLLTALVFAVPSLPAWFCDRPLRNWRASRSIGPTTRCRTESRALSWLAMQAVRSLANASLMNPDLLPSLDQQSAGTGAEVVARLLVGAVLIAISRRRGIGSTLVISDADDADG